MSPSPTDAAPHFAAGGNAHWVLDQTGCDVGTLTCTFKAAGLGNNQGITVVVTAQVTVTYDCVNTKSGKHIPKAFQGVQSTATGQQTYYTERNGQLTGSISLSGMQVATRCPPPQQSPEDLLGPWQATNVVIDGSSGMTLSAPPKLPTLSY